MEGGRMARSGSLLNLEQQRKRAKELVRAHRVGNADAAARIIERLPRALHLTVDQVLAAPFTLSEAQFVIAREAGFASWPLLKRHIESSTFTAADREAALVDLAFAGQDDEVDAALQRDRDVPRRSLAVAAALADVEAAWTMLEADHGVAARAVGRRGWKPLAYSCCSAYRRNDAASLTARLQIVMRLIECGADVNEMSREPGYSDEEWRPLAGAAERVASTELVRLLIAAGASVLKTPGLLSHAVRGGNIDVLRVLLDLSPPDWYQIVWALKASVEIERLDMTCLLITHASRATSGSTKVAQPALIEAVKRERGAEVIEALLGDDRSPLSEPIRTNVYRYALKCGNRGAMEALRKRGVDDRAVTEVDRVIGGCFLPEHRADSSGVTGQPKRRPRQMKDDDDRIVAWAIRRGHFDAVPRLLEAGLDPDVADSDGEMPLHLAVRAESLEAVDALLRARANVNAQNFDAHTPLDVALTLRSPAREQLGKRLRDVGATAADFDGIAAQPEPELFERAADAVAFGDLDTLRRLLDDEPALVHARSPRPHRCTLLNYVGANGTEDSRQRSPKNSGAIAELLLERGADPNATCNLYGGAATTMGLLLTSAHPPAAGVDGDVVRTLIRHGVKITDGDVMGAIEYGLQRSVAAFSEAEVATDNLFLAAGFGRLDLVQQFLADGVDINTQFVDGGYGTALHAAAGMAHADIVTFLLERGADRTLRNRWDATPAGAARYFGHNEIAELIQNHR
jgi:ankyrin repeat protein